MSKEVKIDLSNVDWKALQDQKSVLIEQIGFEEGNLRGDADEDDAIQRNIDGMNGLLHLIDDIQDQAAGILGEDVVFSEGGEYEISLPDPKNDSHFISSGIMSKQEAIAHVRDKFGADEHGRVCLINKVE